MPKLEFWYDFASTYSYLSAVRIEPLAAAAGVEIAHRPFLLGPIFKAQGLTTSPFVLNPAKGRYMWRDLERICAAGGIAFRKPSAFPRTSVLGARLVTTALNELEARQGRYALCTMCIGVGQGIAMVIERV